MATAPTVPQTNRVVTLGDSVTQNNWNNDGTGYPSGGYFNWANALLGQRCEYVNNAGIDGDTAGKVLAQFYTDAVLPYDPGLVVLNVGTNDVLLGIDPAATIAHIERIIDQLTSAGIYVVVGTVIPSTAFDTLTERTAMWNINRYIVNELPQRAGVSSVAWQKAMIAGADGAPKANMLTDGTHPSAIGAHLMGTELAAVLDPLIPAVDVLPLANNDPNNLFTNGMGLGTAGVGGMADGFTGNTSGTTTSKVARTDGIDGAWTQRAVTTSSITRVDILTGFVVGGTYETLWEIETDAAGWAMTNHFLLINCLNAALGLLTPPGNEVTFGTLVVGNNQPSLGYGVWRSRQFTIPATTARIRMDHNTTGTGTFRIGRVLLRRVDI